MPVKRRGFDASPAQESDLSFAAGPASWYYLATLAELKRGPVRFDLPAKQSVVGFCFRDSLPS